MKMIQMTMEIISQGENGNGGWNHKQLQVLGVDTPPRAGWKHRLVGVEFEESIIQKFISLKGNSRSDEYQLDLF